VDAQTFTRMAASAPDTFYGMIARRHLELDDDPLDRVLEAAPVAQPIAATGLDAPGVRRLIDTDPRARRAIALMQIGRPIDAGLELRTGLALAVGDDERAAWTTLVLALNPSHPDSSASVAISRRTPATLYPTPRLDPLGGFVLNKALVYALTWQESRFNSLAVSPVGAVGLMQVMPNSMADVLGDDSLRSDPIPLFDPATNLHAGQQYVNWLRQHAVGPDLLSVVAAYDGGPATLERTRTQVGLDDSLLIVESLPFAETRDYVHKVLAAYWSYRRQFGSDSPTLDAIASGAGVADLALDR
jgi:soluble lytic murein transglycosylase-like protein